MTRATYALFDGRIADAFRMNFVGMILLPLACVGLALEASYWIRGVPPKRRIPHGRYGAATVLVVMIAFFVLRNLPAWPFTLLAPH